MCYPGFFTQSLHKLEVQCSGHFKIFVCVQHNSITYGKTKLLYAFRQFPVLICQYEAGSIGFDSLKVGKHSYHASSSARDKIIS